MSYPGMSYVKGCGLEASVDSPPGYLLPEINCFPPPSQRKKEKEFLSSKQIVETERDQMEAQEKVELIQMAIHKLMMEGEEEEKMKNIVISSEEKRSFLPDRGKDDLNYNPQLLTKLLTQLETLKEGRELQQPSPSADHPEEVPSPEVGEKANRESETTSDLKDRDKEKVGEEIIKELRKVRRQNFITHCLLSAMIVLTVTWQLSEVSLILKVKDGIRHPFRSFGSLLTGMIKRPIQNAQNGVKQSESSALPPLSFP